MGTLMQRWYRMLGLVISILIANLLVPHVTYATQRSDQNLAMHASMQTDVGRVRDAPLYTMVGSVDVASRTLTMRQTVQWTNTTGTVVRELPFRLYANLSDFAGQTRIAQASADGIAVPFTSNRTHTIVTLHLAAPLRPDAVVTVVMQFQTTIPADVGQTKYGAFNDDGYTLSFASAYPLLVDSRDGNWQITDPDTKGDLVNSPVALYDVTLTIPDTHHVVSTGTSVSQSITDNRRTIRVVSGLQRDFTFVVTTLPVHTQMVAGTRINVYAAATEVTGAEQSLRVAARALQLFNAQFGQYPYNELDVVAVDSASFYGVEYPGLILMQTATLAKLTHLERIIVHEVAHQWFYNVVGNDVQRDAWVDEALATYAQVIYLRASAGEEAAQRELAEFQSQYEALMKRDLDGPIHQHMRDYTLYSFNVLAYAKGALFYEALRTALGAEHFTRALREYVARYRYHIADSHSFRAIAESHCACSLDMLYQTWIHP